MMFPLSFQVRFTNPLARKEQSKVQNIVATRVASRTARIQEDTANIATAIT